MVRNRIILIALWILSLVGISFFGGPVSYGFFIAITMVPVVSLVYLFLVFLRFKIYQKLDARHVVVDQISDFYITLQNEDFFAFSGVRIKFFSPFSSISGIDDSEEYELMPRSGIKKQTSLICKYRGEYEVGVKSVVIQDFFRIFKFTYRNREPFRVTVFPRILDLDSIKTIDDAQTTSADSYQNPTEPDAVVRDYTPGDDIRMIHWKSSAKQGKLLVRKMIGEEKQGIGIIMDSARYYEKPEAFLPVENKVCEAVVALTMYYLKNHTPVKVYTYPEKASEILVKDTGEFDIFYKHISGFRFEKENTAAAMFAGLSSESTLFQNKLVIMVLQKWSGEARNIASLLGQNNISTVIYLVDDNPDEVATGKILSRSELHIISSDADLGEVL